MTTLGASQLLLKTAEVIEERGWTQGKYIDADGCVCVYGAMHVAQGRAPLDAGTSNPAEAHARLALLRTLHLPNSFVVDPLAAWNDAPERTAVEVVTALRTAAGMR